jgi:conjugative transfer signal peptidase TraF
MTHRGQLALLNGGLVGVVILAGTAAIFYFVGLRIDASASLPIGFYKITGDPTAELIEFCPPEPFASLSARRGYRGRGTCPDGFEPLMKPILARAGDIVDVSAKGVAINGRRLIFNSAPRFVDTKGRPLAHWPFGKYRVASGAVWVVSSFNSRSFDSRYFGTILLSSVGSRLRPILTE